VGFLGRPEDAVVGSKPVNMVVHTSGFDDVPLEGAQICRDSKDLGTWVGKFREVRASMGIPRVSVDFEVKLTLKDGRVLTFAVEDEGTGLEYWTDTDSLYKPQEVKDFQISVTRESWIDEANAAKQKAEQEAREAKLHATENARAARLRAMIAAQERETRDRQRVACRTMHQNTSNKKVSELTVKESREIRACDSLGIYPPD
jgi:hypothetical protein